MNRCCLTLIISFLHSYYPTSCQSEIDTCILPGSWSGLWFESGVRGSISINTSTMIHKGKCVKKLKHSSQFIFRNSKEGNCLRCLSIHQKHANVLQYKESKCITERKNFKDICRTISVDEPLKSLFRVNASGVNCPIHGTYSYSYSRGHGLCSYPLSSLHQCSDKSRLVFSYQACVDIKGSQSQTEQAHCIADWKEGSTYYFVAQMNSSHVTTADMESSFRCFVYKEIHSGYLLAQSAEAKCNLYTATEGYRTMSLKRLKQDGSTCHFPGWFTAHRRYHSLTYSNAYQLNKAGTALTLETVGSQETAKLECLNVKSETNSTALFTVQSVRNCSVGFHCMQVVKKTANIFSIKIGRLSPNNEDACHTQLFFDNTNPTTTITTAHLHSSSCPLTGNYALRNNNVSSNCSNQVTLSSGCHSSHKMKLTASCLKDIEEYSCHGNWEEEKEEASFSKKSFSIVSYKTESTSAKSCLIKYFNEKQDELSLSLKKDCYSDSSSDNIWSFTALNYGDCAPTALATSNSALQNSSTVSVILLMKLIAMKIIML